MWCVAWMQASVAAPRYGLDAGRLDWIRWPRGVTGEVTRPWRGDARGHLAMVRAVRGRWRTSPCVSVVRARATPGVTWPWSAWRAIDGAPRLVSRSYTPGRPWASPGCQLTAGRVSAGIAARSPAAGRVTPGLAGAWSGAPDGEVGPWPRMVQRSRGRGRALPRDARVEARPRGGVAWYRTSGRGSDSGALARALRCTRRRALAPAARD